MRTEMRRETAMTHYVRKGIKEREGRGESKREKKKRPRGKRRDGEESLNYKKAKEGER